MKVFVSSVIRGMEAYREAAVRGVKALGHEATRAEDFPAMSASPRQACLAGVREADAVVLLLGGRYGGTLASGISATHEEYREARGKRPVLAFVQTGVEVEHAQQAFVDEVRTWEGGSYTASFVDPEDLRDAVTRALHEFELSRQPGDVDEQEMLQRASDLLPESRGFSGASLTMVVVGGPRQVVLRPAQIEDRELERHMLMEALVGDYAVLSTSDATNTRRTENQLALEQQNASVLVDDLGSVRIVQPAAEHDRFETGLPALIEDEVRERLERACRVGSAILDRIDAVHRLRQVVPVVSLSGASHMAWRTRKDQQRSTHSMQVPMASDPQVVTLSPAVRPRPSLAHDTTSLVEDFVSVLRRRLTT